MKLPIYELKINDAMTDEAEVNYVALVDAPAIKKDFIAFKEEFIEPSKGEHETDFIPRCIAYVVNEGKNTEQATAICYSVWEQHFAGTKVSIDYDDTLSTDRGKALAKRLIANGDVVYIISARQDKEGMLSVAKDLGIPESRVYATGSNSAKVAKITSLDISKHYDNNADVIKELGSKGEKFKMGFAITNEDEHIISGCLMEADLPIYRNNEKFGEHYVVFSADTIKQIAIKFAKKHYQSNVNLMHDANKVVDGCTMFESFIVDKSRGIMPMQGFEGIADGSWFGSFYVENPKVWEQIKSGELKGFSVEGMFDYEIPLDSEQQKLKEIELLLNSLS